MTRQTTEPLPEYRLSATNRTASEIAGPMLEHIDLNPPYQRGPVWTEDQQVALVKSWVMGVPVPAVVFNNRDSHEWRVNEGDAVHRGTAPTWAVVDGKQRILTAVAWFSGALAVPASWFPADRVARAKETADGPYVTYPMLTKPGRRFISNRALLPIVEAKLPSLRDEADLYLLLNGGGTAQTERDMDRAARVAQGVTR